MSLPHNLGAPSLCAPSPPPPTRQPPPRLGPSPTDLLVRPGGFQGRQEIDKFRHFLGHAQVPAIACVRGRCGGSSAGFVSGVPARQPPGCRLASRALRQGPGSGCQPVLANRMLCSWSRRPKVYRTHPPGGRCPERSLGREMCRRGGRGSASPGAGPSGHSTGGTGGGPGFQRLQARTEGSTTTSIEIG